MGNMMIRALTALMVWPIEKISREIDVVPTADAR